MSEDSRISQYDLRLKLMRKNPPKQIHGVHEDHNRMDLRVKLSKQVQSPPIHPMMEYKSEMKGSSLYRKMPPRGSADDLLLVDSLRNSYSSRTINGLRARSTERNLRTSSHFSPPRNYDGMWKIPTLREPDASRAGRFPNMGIGNVPRPTAGIPMTIKPAPETVRQVSHGPPASCSMQQNLHMVPFAGHCSSSLLFNSLFKAECDCYFIVYSTVTSLCLSTGGGTYHGCWFVTYTWLGKVHCSFPG